MISLRNLQIIGQLRNLRNLTWFWVWLQVFPIYRWSFETWSSQIAGIFIIARGTHLQHSIHQKHLIRPNKHVFYESWSLTIISVQIFGLISSCLRHGELRVALDKKSTQECATNATLPEGSIAWSAFYFLLIKIFVIMLSVRLIATIGNITLYPIMQPGIWYMAELNSAHLKFHFERKVKMWLR